VLIILLSIGFLSLKNIFKIYIFSTAQYTQLEQNENLVSVDIDESEELNNLKPTPASKYYIAPSSYNYGLLLGTLCQLFIIIGRAVAIVSSARDDTPGRNIEPVVTVGVWIYIAFLTFLNRTNMDKLNELRLFYILLTITDFLKLRSQLFIEKHTLNYIVEAVFNVTILLINIYLMITSLQLTKKIKLLNQNALNEKLFPSPENLSSLFNRLTFSWVNPLLNYGYRNAINPEDVWTMEHKETASFLGDDFHNFESKAQSFEGKLFRYFLTPLIYQSFWSIGAMLIAFLNPYFLYLFLNFIGTSTKEGVADDFYNSVEYGFYLVCGMLTTTFLKSLADSQALFYGRRLGISIKTIVISEVYRKILHRKDQSSVKEGGETSNPGKITNFMSVDCHEIAEACSYMNYIYTLPIQIIISLVALYMVLGWTAFVALGMTLFMMPINMKVSAWWDKVQQQLMAASDKRMDNINELLQGIRIIKFFAWEDQFKTKIRKSRDAELKVLTRRTVVWLIAATIWFCFPMALTCVCFVIYTRVAGNDLTSPIAFTALLVFKMLREPVDQLPDIINMLLQAKVSLGRINGFLKESDTSKYENLSVPATANDPIIGFENATLEWEGTEAFNGESSENGNTGEDANIPSVVIDASPAFTIPNLNLSFPEKELSIIVGPTGCGKTSMLLGLLGEMNLTSGKVFLPKKFPVTNNQHDHDFSLNGGIAYVSQSAWLQQATIRDNILFGEPFNQQRYSQVIRICALLPDFQTLTDGDLTEVGEKGITLSGGQKQRVSLARAVYSRASHIILDDCLSAVDAHTAKYLFRKCIMGDIMRGRTRILVTHNISLTFPHAAYAVVMGARGTISGVGKPDELRELEEIKSELASEESQIEEEEDHAAATADIPANLGTEADPTKKLVEEEERATGKVKLSIYSTYFKAVGGMPYWAVFCLLFVLYQALPLALDWWIRIWTSSYDKEKSLGIFSSGTKYYPNIFNFATVKDHSGTSMGLIGSNTLLPPGYKWTQSVYSAFKVSDRDDMLNYYIIVYVVIGLSCVISVGLRVAYQFYGSLKASRYLHDSMLSKILRAPVRFFDTTPIGRIVNRFSKDIQCIDGELMPSTGVLVAETLATIFIMAFITYMMPLFVIPIIIICIIYYGIIQYYVSLSRELKRIESVTRSPIYAQCSETINGVVVIRAFEQEPRFLKSNDTLIDGNMKNFFYMWVANRWLSIRTDTVGGLVAFFCGSLLLLTRNTGSSSAAGFALNQALNFSSHILWLARFYSIAEMNLNSIERVNDYLEIESEAPEVIEENRPASNWPQKGQVEIKDLVLRYAKDLDPVIKGITLQILAGEKVGVVGRTGAGKSTLALAFFRFLEASEGSISIDDVDISKIGVKDLRSSLTIIPQEAILFSGTIRTNLDPFNEHTDDDLWNALKRVHIVDQDYVPGQGTSSVNTPTGLETPPPIDASALQLKRVAIKSLDQAVTENGQNFSQGQRQLLSLARALLRQSKVIIMDEGKLIFN
jgi:ABC-type multidrug transport system fused ATPase/permease subunit